MAKDINNQKPIGSFRNNHGRWGWLVKLPGDEKRRMISLVPPGQKMALKCRPDNEPDAWRIAWRILRERTGDAGDCISIAAMTSSYIAAEAKRVSKSQIHAITSALKWLTAAHGGKPADSIGIDELREIRDKLKLKYTRETVNKYLRIIQRCYSWAKDEGFVDAYTARLISDFGILPPRTECGGQHKDIKPVNIVDVQATLPELTPTIRDMVIVQFICDMRPGEACIMRMCDIDKSDTDVWIYEPKTHKNAHRGQLRFVAILPEAREIIQRRASGRPKNEYLFKVEESEQERLEAANAVRKTPLEQGNKPGSNKKDIQKFAECFTSTVYARHVSRAIEQLNRQRKLDRLPPIEPWTPNQLRHARATENRAKHGKEIAALLLGHAKDSNATDIYTRQAIKDEFREKAKAELREAVKKITNT